MTTDLCRTLDPYVDPFAPQPTIDLRRCKPGDRVRFANGDVGVYLKNDGDNHGPPHHVRGSDGWIWFFDHDGEWKGCRDPDRGHYVVEVIGPTPTSDQSPTDETLKAEFIQHLYAQSGRTCGTFSGLWAEFRQQCLQEHLDALAEQLAQEKRRVWGQQRKGGES